MHVRDNIHMIITKIIGGLGNQMFQYAVARDLALRHGNSFKVDIAAFDHYSLHQGFELNRIFGNVAPIVDKPEILRILGWQALPWVRRYLSHHRFSKFRSQAFVQEPGLDYWPAINNVPENCYLSGYWQSASYFNQSEAAIREDFSFVIPLSKENQAIADVMAGCSAVSLHVRRGDYVANAVTNAHHGTCSIAYYESAIKYITERVTDPVFFVFSDDIDWVKSHINISNKAHFIEHNKGQNSYCDMQLMSLCKHHIIANSSFSWWGAWLGSNPEKIVIAPQQWFAQSATPDGLIPASWICL